MATFRYTDPEPRHYPDPGIGEVRHGDRREFPVKNAPEDGRWERVDTPKRHEDKPSTADQPADAGEPEPEEK